MCGRVDKSISRLGEKDTRPKIPNWLLDIDSSSFPRPSVLMSRKGKRQNQNKEEQQETYLAEQEN
jgi:hypothetical protein